MESVKHSATAFFNSFLMESSHHQLSTVGSQLAYSIALSNEELIVPLTYHSKLGRHEYAGRFFLKSGESMESISFEAAVRKLLSHLTSKESDLLERVLESHNNISEILSNRRQELIRMFDSNPDFITTEQALFAGHSLHPAPKSRQGFTKIDSKLYSPESKAHFPLRWFFVHQDLVIGRKSKQFTDNNWPAKVFSSEFPQIKIPQEKIPFPMHPWQATRILSRPDVMEHVRSGQIEEVGGIGPDWKPTSSLRTLYRRNSPFMLKFSLDVKLTNSVRHMLAHELDRGLQVHEVLASEKGKEFLQKSPDFRVMFEPVYLAIKDQNGNPIKETFVMGRENQFSLDDHYLLAFMTQNHPEFRHNFIQKEVLAYSEDTNLPLSESAIRWLDSFLKKVIKPFIHAEAEYGILLGAHQQNLLVKMENHLPVGAVFRDCHGTGYSPRGFENFGRLLDPENGNILDDEKGTFLFSYYLIINSLFNVIGAMSSGNLISEEKLIERTTNTFVIWKSDELSTSHCLNYLLSRSFLMHKGNFLCSLKKINENTTTNPLDIYVEIANPFYQRGNHHE